MTHVRDDDRADSPAIPGVDAPGHDRVRLGMSAPMRHPAIPAGRADDRADGRAMAVTFIVFFFVVLLWRTPVLFPLRLLVVLFHELSHGLAALATGGAIERIELGMNEGGVCFTRGGNAFLITSAGYVGSMAWGAALLVLSGRTDADRKLSVALGLFLAVITLAYVRTVAGFLFALSFALFLIVVGRKLSTTVNDLLLRMIGVTSCLYAILDISSDVLERRNIGSDAETLARTTGVPSVVWGVLWIAVSLVVAVVALRVATKDAGR